MLYSHNCKFIIPTEGGGFAGSFIGTRRIRNNRRIFYLQRRHLEISLFLCFFARGDLLWEWPGGEGTQGPAVSSLTHFPHRFQPDGEH
jgi:hypothetical protein